MRALLLLSILLATPTIAYAHSGAVLRVAVNYIPLLLALVPILWSPLAKLINRLQGFRKKEDKKDPQN